MTPNDLSQKETGGESWNFSTEELFQQLFGNLKLLYDLTLLLFSNQTQRLIQSGSVIANVCELLKTNFVAISFSDIQAAVDGGGIIMSNSNRWATFSGLVLCD